MRPIPATGMLTSGYSTALDLIIRDATSPVEILRKDALGTCPGAFLEGR